MHNRLIVLVLTGTLVLGGCAMTKEEAGTATGAVAGGVLGSTIGDGRGQIAATFVGMVLGALVGQEVGRSLDRMDEWHAQHVLEYNRAGETTRWVNPDGDQEVAITPTKTYERSPGQYCREFQTEITVGGKREKAYGTACRQADGSWKILN